MIKANMKMTKNEYLFLAELLGQAGEEFSNHSCTDMDDGLSKILSEEEKRILFWSTIT